MCLRKSAQSPLKDHDYCEKKRGIWSGTCRCIHLRKSVQSALKDHDYYQRKRVNFTQRGGSLCNSDSRRSLYHKRGSHGKHGGKNGCPTSKWLAGKKVRAWLKKSVGKAKHRLWGKKKKRSPRDPSNTSPPISPDPSPEPPEPERGDGEHGLGTPLEGPSSVPQTPRLDLSQEPTEPERGDGDYGLGSPLEGPSNVPRPSPSPRPEGSEGWNNESVVEDSLEDPLSAPWSPKSSEDVLPDVHMVRVRRQEWSVARFGGMRYTEEFRFVNLERVPLHVAYEAITHGVEEIVAELRQRFTGNDYAQLRIQADSLSNCLYSRAINLNKMTPELFLEWLSKLLQSQREIFLDSTFRLVVIVVKGRGGGSRRVISSIPYSQIITKKRKYLIDLNTYDTNLCFAGSLLAVTKCRGARDVELLDGAKELHRKLGLSIYQKVMLQQVPLFEDLEQLNVHIVMHKEKTGWSLFKTQDTPRYPVTCFLLLHGEHYYGVLNVRNVFGMRNYCDLCQTLYSHSHTCRFRCRLCLSPNCSENMGRTQRCPNCKLFCRSKECLEKHVALASENRIECLTKTLCDERKSYVDKKHECTGRQCKQCYGKITDVNKHWCFMRQIKEPEEGEGYIFYDFECVQEMGMHVPNYIFAMELKTGEKKPQKDAGKNPKRVCKAKPKKPESTWEFKGEECLSDFIKVFMDKKFKNYTFIAHSAKGYDGYFVVSQLLKEKMGVKLITQGGKLMCIEVTRLGIRFIDSLIFLPMKLSRLPQVMGFEGCKGYFPHFFNRAENQNYVGPLPKMEYYGIENMMSSEKGQFLEWYQNNRDKTFDMQKELAYYCHQDVKILKEACCLYRNEIMKMTRRVDRVKVDGELQNVVRCIDPFQYITLASVCMAMYRFMFLEPQTVALLPPDNYHRQKKRFSSPSIQWLMYISEKENIQIQHALQGGEFHVGPYFLDGYANIGGEPTAFEFNGCFFHGCVTCYNEKDQNPLTGTTFGFLNYQALHKIDYLKREGFTVRTIWEHE
ncbi:uncharacterized protein LOC132250018 [Alligator mississippiensis]|uniref:uncharacterized protein LOC132250018 n=1 Tax=Alligator mississippiensis TaxID=8496 RepID=UPI00287771AB|nr:uncharacterized protein LOC132250018 [Alligator mississippiensis]